MILWIGLGIFALLCIFLILWLLHKQVKINIHLIYSKEKKVFRMTVTWLFFQMEFVRELPSGEELLDRMANHVSNKKEAQIPFKRILQQMKAMAASLELTEFTWKTELGLSQANETAIAYGIGQSVKHTIFQGISCYMKRATAPEIAIQPNFDQLDFQTDLSCIFSAPLGHIIGNIRRLKSIYDEVSNHE